MELEICLDKNLEKMDCPSSMLNAAETCPETKPVYYRPIQHSGEHTVMKEEAKDLIAVPQGKSMIGDDKLVYRQSQQLSSANVHQLL